MNELKNQHFNVAEEKIENLLRLNKAKKLNSTLKTLAILLIFIWIALIVLFIVFYTTKKFHWGFWLVFSLAIVLSITLFIMNLPFIAASHVFKAGYIEENNIKGYVKLNVLFLAKFELKMGIKVFNIFTKKELKITKNELQEILKNYVRIVN